MNKILNTTSVATLFTLPAVVSAQQGLADSASGGDFGNILVDILNITNDVLIPFILGIGFLVFVWGMFRYFIAGGANDEAKEQGKSLMVYATLGFVLIIVFWGVVNLIAGSTGLDDPSLDFNNNGLNNVDLNTAGSQP